MEFQLLIGFVLTLMPVTELRVGLPLIIDYCLKNNLSILPFFLLVVLLNVFVIFLAYSFLEFLHKYLIKWKFYAKIFNRFIEKLRKKNDKFEKKFNEIGYLALVLFVAIPLPGTGAWTGTLVAWLFGLEKRKSVLAISLGVLIAGILILIASLGILGIFY